MEFLAFLLVIVFTVISMSKNKKQGSAAAKPGAPANNGRRPAKGAPARAKQPAAPAAETETVIPTDLDEIIADVKSRISGERTVAKRRSEPVVKAMKRSGTVQGASMLEDADCAGGSMAHTHTEGHSALEDEDCFGGSMEHTHSEGVSRVAQARHMAAIDAKHDEDVLPETFDARALRRAVVMAEVLGKPKALRTMRN